jgi:signal transduction histidine kinase/CheY-like chemotaxis protein
VENEELILKWTPVIRKNYKQLLIVFLIFLVMVLVSYLSSSIIFERQLVNGTNELLRTVEANIRSSLREPEAMLASSVFNIRDRIVRDGESQRDILRYMVNLTRWLLEDEERLLGFNGIYGVVRGEYLDGMLWKPPPEYSPQERPWYKAAKAAGGQIVVTPRYIDAHTNFAVISFAQEIFDADTESLGVLSIDMLLPRLNDYVRSLQEEEGGYGMLLDHDLRLMSHPRKEFVDKPLAELSADGDAGRDYARFARELEAGEEILARQIRDIDGRQVIIFFRQIYNGWYVGVVTPAEGYFRSIYRMALILALVGLFLMLILCFMLLRLSAERMRSDEESKSKSSLLARISHEIRTPMNTVIGMSELALRAQTLPKMTEYVTGIKQAGLSLISLINAILDFSMSEAGSLRISSEPYRLASLVNDVINVAQVRIAGKPILFTANVDAGIPNNLIGDEARIRQILLKLLSNAARYTHEGFIMLTVSAHFRHSRPSTKRHSRGLSLSLKIADSGSGIKKEVLPGLFGNFTQLSAERDRNAEGTGLGLTIVRSLCRAMGGDITVQSEYAKGSTFTVTIPQIYTDDQKLAVAENSGEKKTLLYDERALYAESVFLTLENLGVPVMVTVDSEDFLGKLEKGNYAFCFVSKDVMDRAAALIREKSLKTVLVLLEDLGEISSFQDIPAISMPAYAIPIANVLNGVSPADARSKTDIRFIAPAARILIVDDITTNLKVAEGLLALYQPEIHTCTGGVQAIELVKEHEYDIVFMDHMMPDMDGIEAVAAIRALKGRRFQELPIIALTANAISGMKEMFLEKGFNDYLAKPIEMSKLAEIMSKWIPREKRLKAGGEVGQEPEQTETPAGFSLFQRLKGALNSKNGEAADSILKELGAISLDAKTCEALEAVSGYVLVSDFTQAARIVDELLAAGKERA